MSDAFHNTHSEDGLPIAGRRTGLVTSEFEQVVFTGSGDENEYFGEQEDAGASQPNFTGFEQLPRDVGWLLFGVGFAGVVAPGIFGLPFMVGGGMILWPKTSKRLFELLGGDSSQPMNAGVKQVYRFLDDLEKRYPRR